MPSFKEIATAVTVWIMFAFATGHRQWIYDGIVFMRKNAIQESQKKWSCPSIFNRNACTQWSGARR